MVDNTPRVLAGRYEVGELIGRGGMAEVHIGHDTRLGRTVAIKVLRSDLARDPSFLARFRREAQAAAALNHPSIVAVYDTGEDVHHDSQGGEVHVPFIVMEYVEGHTVRDILHDGAAVPIEEAVEITVGVLSALEYSHHAGIVHRDIKPANVMITPTGAVKVMDFGIARAMADSASTMTQTHAVIGTAQYLSPEQARGEQVDTRSDLYSTGCVLFELLTGRPPFQGDSPVAVAYQHVGQAPQRPSEIATDVPDVLDRITLKALTKDRDQRYSTAAEFRADLDAAMRGGQVAAPMIGGGVGMGGAATTVMMGPATGQYPPYGGAGATQVMAPMGNAPVAGAPWGGPAGPTTPGGGFPGPGGPGGRAPQRQETDTKKTLLWTLVGIAAAALVAIVIFMLMQQGTEQVRVPTLTAGMTTAEAEAAIKEVGLVPVLTVDPEATVEQDTVTGVTDPPAGEEVEEGSDVLVYYAGQPGSATIPDVSGQTREAATTALEARGFTVNAVPTAENHASIKKDLVIKTDPGAGATVSTDTAITLFVSTGKVTVPDVTGDAEDDARRTLQDLGLQVDTRTVESEEPVGTVVEQNPPAGDVDQGSRITLGIAEEPAPDLTQVPTGLVGMTQAEAEEALGGANLNSRIETAYSEVVERGEVISSNPQPGSQVETGTEVTIVISLGSQGSGTSTPSPTPTPTPTPTP